MTRIHPSCEAWLERVSARLDGELEPVEAALVESHLAACPSCRAIEAEFVAAERRVAAAVEARVAEAPLDGLAAAVLSKLHAEDRPGEPSGPGRILFVRFLSMVAAAGVAAAGLLAAFPRGALPAPSAPPPELARPHPPVETGDAVALLCLFNNDVVEDPGRAPDLVQTITEAEQVFYAALNAGGPADLAAVQAGIASNGLIVRCRRLADLSWSNPQAAQEIGNVADNVAIFGDSRLDLGKVQWQLSNSGALLSCDNLLVGSSAGANSYTAGNTRWNAVPNNAVATPLDPPAILFFSTYERLAVGDPRGAIAACDRVLAEHPDSAWADDALYRKGQIAETYLQDYAQARSCYLGVIEQHPESTLSNGCLLNETRVSLKDGSWSRESVARNFETVEEQVVKTLAAGALSNRVYQRANSQKLFLDGNLEDDPRAFELFVQAETALQQGDRAKAHAHLDEILERHGSAPIHEEAMILKSEVLRLEGRTPEALRILDDVQRTYPDGAAGRYAEQVRRVVEERRSERATK